MTAEELYQQEIQQSDHDHHVPTAGAMTGHVIANLIIHSQKINQAKLFAKGKAVLFLDHYANSWVATERATVDRLTRILVNNGKSIPTTTEQFLKYTMLEENGADKFQAGNQQLFGLIQDLDTQILFITKAIPLADKENWPELSAALTQLLACIKGQINLGQRFLSHDLREGLYNEEDDDEF